jgi:hypothetical protein
MNLDLVKQWCKTLKDKRAIPPFKFSVFTKYYASFKQIYFSKKRCFFLKVPKLKVPFPELMDQV